MIKEIEIEDNISLVKALYKAWVVDGYSMARRYIAIWKVKVNDETIKNPEYEIIKEDFNENWICVIKFNKQEIKIFR